MVRDPADGQLKEVRPCEAAALLGIEFEVEALKEAELLLSSDASSSDAASSDGSGSPIAASAASPGMPVPWPLMPLPLPQLDPTEALLLACLAQQPLQLEQPKPA